MYWATPENWKRVSKEDLFLSSVNWKRDGFDFYRYVHNDKKFARGRPEDNFVMVDPAILVPNLAAAFSTTEDN